MWSKLASNVDYVTENWTASFVHTESLLCNLKHPRWEQIDVNHRYGIQQ